MGNIIHLDLSHIDSVLREDFRPPRCKYKCHSCGHQHTKFKSDIVFISRCPLDGWMTWCNQCNAKILLEDWQARFMDSVSYRKLGRA